MPNLRIETNVEKDKIADMNAFLAELSKALAATTGKPEQYMVVQVIPGVSMMFGGSADPCANAFFMCIGKMGPEENKVHAANLFPVITKHLGVPEDRMYILFRDAPTHEVAWKSTTFQDILGK
eukprot:GFUD01003151.1.p2 GENE.GFUD01003151.1~~GFUD01003151.1.p2  ORF type:complete len:123 (-),score=31.60 GFUD01003151.1:281-649(-)